MRTLKYLLEKEFRQIFRNPNILKMIIAIPIVQLLIMPLAADYEIKNINVSIVDHDRSSYSRQLTQKITASGYFRLTDYTHDYQLSFENFESDQSDLILEIPNNFERNLIKEAHSGLFLAVNAINGTKASVGSSYLNQIIQDFNTDIRIDWTAGRPLSRSPNIEVVSSNWFNAGMNYQQFMVPGILVILVTMVGAYMCALNIVKEKEIGTIEQINVTPIKKHHFLLGKLIPFWIIGVIVFTIGLFGVGRVVYGVISQGSILLLYGYLAVFLVAVLGIGLLDLDLFCQSTAGNVLGFFHHDDIYSNGRPIYFG